MPVDTVASAAWLRVVQDGKSSEIQGYLKKPFQCYDCSLHLFRLAIIDIINWDFSPNFSVRFSCIGIVDVCEYPIIDNLSIFLDIRPCMEDFPAMNVR